MVARGGQQVVIALFISCLLNQVTPQTFQYSRGWTNGKKRSGDGVFVKQPEYVLKHDTDVLDVNTEDLDYAPLKQVNLDALDYLDTGYKIADLQGLKTSELDDIGVKLADMRGLGWKTPRVSTKIGVSQRTSDGMETDVGRRKKSPVYSSHQHTDVTTSQSLKDRLSVLESNMDVLLNHLRAVYQLAPTGGEGQSDLQH